MGSSGSLGLLKATKQGKSCVSPSKFDGSSSYPVIDKQRLEDYDEAMRRIKDATGVSDVNEIIQKFATQ